MLAFTNRIILAIENETCYDERADTSWHIKHKLNSIHEKKAFQDADILANRKCHFFMDLSFVKNTVGDAQWATSPGGKNHENSGD